MCGSKEEVQGTVKWKCGEEATLASKRSFDAMSDEGNVERGEADLLGFFKSFLEKQLKERNMIES